MTVQHDAAFLQALCAATKAALAMYPAEKETIRRAVALVLDGHVTPATDPIGTYLVTASEKGAVYRVNGACQCANFATAQGGRCKHRFSVWVYRKTQKILAADPWHTKHSVELRDQLAGIETTQETVEMPTTDRFGKPTGKKTTYTHTVNTLPREPDGTLTMPQSLVSLVCSPEHGHRAGGQHAQSAGR